jgi:hypothetical protein
MAGHIANAHAKCLHKIFLQWILKNKVSWREMNSCASEYADIIMCNLHITVPASYNADTVHTHSIHISKVLYIIQHGISKPSFC